MTTRNIGLPVAALRAAGIAATAVFVAGLLVVSSPPAGAEPVAAAQTAQPVTELLAGAPAADAAAAPAAADDLVGDITFSVPSGTFQGEVAVTLSSTISGAQIRYTTNGQPPTAQSSLYSGSALRFTRTTQLRAQAFVGQTATGAPGTAMYAAQNVTTAHDLPVVLIDSYGAGRPDREYFDATTMIFEPTGGGTTSLAAAPTLSTRAGFRLRGNSSATFEKTPFRVEFWDNENDDADHPVLGMPADSDWVLRGPFPDKALIREALVYDLGREMGLPAPRYAFAEFYLNTDAAPVGAGDYMGVYMFMETIKNSKDRLDLKQLDSDDVTLPKIQGGYIWKFEWMAAEEPTLPCTGPAATCWNYLEVADPSPLQPQQRDWLRGHLQEFNDVLHCVELRRPDHRIPQVHRRRLLHRPHDRQRAEPGDGRLRPQLALLQGPGQQDLRGSAVGLRPQLRRRWILRQRPGVGLAAPADPATVGQRLVRPVAARPRVRQPGPIALADATTGPALRRRAPDPDQCFSRPR